MNKYATIAATVAALVAASAVQARPPAVQTVIRITGSTAFRAAVFTALKNDYFDSAPTVFPSGANGSSSKFTFVGKKSSAFGANDVVVEFAGSGSVEGLINVLNTSGSSPVSQPTFINASGATESTPAAADLAFSDVAQNTTTFTTASYGSAPELNAGSAYAGQGIGVVTFAFVANRNANNLVSNITSDQFQVLAANGSLSQGYFTGAGSSDTTQVYLTGRYPFSGTRLTIGAVTGFGANADQVLWSASGSDALTGNDVAQPGKTPATGSTTWDDVADHGGGYVSGGNVAKVLNNSSQNQVIIGYLGLGDARNAGVNGSTNIVPLTDKLISFNGVAPSKANVTAGTYDLWSYEHLYGKKVGGVSTDVAKFVNGTTAATTPLTSNGFIHALDVELQADLDYLSLNQINSSRQSDGGVVAPGF